MSMQTEGFGSIIKHTDELESPYGSGLNGDLAMISSTMYYQQRIYEFNSFSMDGDSHLRTVANFPYYVDISSELPMNLSGTIDASGAAGTNAVGSSGGSGGQAGPGSQSGYDGHAGQTNGGQGGDPRAIFTAVPLFNIPNPFIAYGGTGGASGGDGGRSGGAGDTDSGTIWVNLLSDLIRGIGITLQPSTGGGGGGGGGGDGDHTNGGGSGGGGGGGGLIILRAPIINLYESCYLNVSGGNGGNGANGQDGGGPTGGGGGGGGGSGGAIVFICETLLQTWGGLMFLGGEGGNGGTGTNGGADGLPGQNATDGSIYWYKPSTNTWTNLNPP